MDHFRKFFHENLKTCEWFHVKHTQKHTYFERFSQYQTNFRGTAVFTNKPQVNFSIALIGTCKLISRNIFHNDEVIMQYVFSSVKRSHEKIETFESLFFEMVSRKRIGQFSARYMHVLILNLVDCISNLTFLYWNWFHEKSVEDYCGR